VKCIHLSWKTQKRIVPFGLPKIRLEDNIKMDLGQVFKNMWIELLTALQGTTE
jgi:hypothetical protein